MILPVACIGYILPLWLSLMIGLSVEIGSIALIILGPVVLFISGCCYMFSGAWVAPEGFKYKVQLPLILAFIVFVIMNWLYIPSSSSDKLFIIPSAIGVITMYVLELKTSKNSIQSNKEYNNSIEIKDV
jgi:hypothetical protein